MYVGNCVQTRTQYVYVENIGIIVIGWRLNAKYVLPVKLINLTDNLARYYLARFVRNEMQNEYAIVTQKVVNESLPHAFVLVGAESVHVLQKLAHEYAPRS